MSVMVALNCFWFEYLPWKNFKVETLCAQLLLYTLRYFDDTWHISGHDGVLCTVNNALHRFMFELSPLCDLKRGKPFRSITPMLFEIFGCISRQCAVCRHGLPPLLPVNFKAQ